MKHADESISDVRRNMAVYDAQAERYSWYGLYSEEKYIVTKYFEPGSRVLDLGCGGGRTTVVLHESGFAVKGVDLSRNLIRMAQRRFPHLSFEEGSYTDIKEPDGSFDVVLISHNGIDYTSPASNRQRAISESHRVLGARGLFVLSTHNIRSLLFSPLYCTNGRRFVWMLRNCPKGLGEAAYVDDLDLRTHYVSIDRFVDQVTASGFELEEIVTYKARMEWQRRWPRLLYWISPYVHFVFRKTAA